jgi:SAM-dependent methyltransferase
MGKTPTDEKINAVAAAWVDTLKAAGYETPQVNCWTRAKFFLLSRVWRRILRHTGLKRRTPVRALEFGCGGGYQLIPLAANGWHCTGIDCSPEVLDRARAYAAAVAARGALRGSATFKLLDFMQFEPEELFDLSFQFGVLEHYLDAAARLRYLQKMFDCTRPGGFVVSYVPNGGHPWRARQKEQGLGGYGIPEIDYTGEMLAAEMRACGARAVTVLPHNLCGYLRIIPAGTLQRRGYDLLYTVLQLPIFNLLPATWLQSHAYWWLAIARK